MQEEACFFCGDPPNAKHPIKFQGIQPKLCAACRTTPELIATLNRIRKLEATEVSLKEKLVANQERQKEIRADWLKMRARYQKYISERGASPFVQIG